MCGGGMDPSVFRSESRKARKPHGCDECAKPIAAGESYQHVTGCWDGHWSSYDFCSQCDSVRGQLQARMDGDMIPFGHLVECLRDDDLLSMAIYGCAPAELGHAAGLVYANALWNADEEHAFVRARKLKFEWKPL